MAVEVVVIDGKRQIPGSKFPLCGSCQWYDGLYIDPGDRENPPEHGFRCFRAGLICEPEPMACGDFTLLDPHELYEGEGLPC